MIQQLMKKILFVISTLLFISCQKEVVEYKLIVNSNIQKGKLLMIQFPQFFLLYKFLINGLKKKLIKQ